MAINILLLHQGMSNMLDPLLFDRRSTVFLVTKLIYNYVWKYINNYIYAYSNFQIVYNLNTYKVKREE